MTNIEFISMASLVGLPEQAITEAISFAENMLDTPELRTGYFQTVIDQAEYIMNGTERPRRSVIH